MRDAAGVTLRDVHQCAPAFRRDRREVDLRLLSTLATGDALEPDYRDDQGDDPDEDEQSARLLERLQRDIDGQIAREHVQARHTPRTEQHPARPTQRTARLRDPLHERRAEEVAQ
ncbi:hypothetical protein [Noviluteimonas gilva]|uniref:Uncharacterized protein n=1 Tax=Noviluteimonas gilva TaxID=2682097 RepID=A0A7C9HT00_9GAMM|nr:hypothetical protein [Lysobacter gilvus]MUV14533.1 hypothetical protein [Lysobacter gilvus]